MYTTCSQVALYCVAPVPISAGRACLCVSAGHRHACEQPMGRVLHLAMCVCLEPGVGGTCADPQTKVRALKLVFPSAACLCEVARVEVSFQVHF